MHVQCVKPNLNSIHSSTKWHISSGTSFENNIYCFHLYFQYVTLNIYIYIYICDPMRNRNNEFTLIIYIVKKDGRFQTLIIRNWARIQALKLRQAY